MISSREIQGWAVCLHFDAALVHAVYAGAPVPGLDDAAREVLTRVDRRAWTVDGRRRARALAALLDEYPVTVAVLGLDRADAFFSTEAFRSGARGRGVLALDFGDWAGARVPGLGALERAVAGARRAQVQAGRGFVTTPGVVALTAPSGTLVAWSELRAALGTQPAEALASGAALPRVHLGPSTEHLLVERQGDDVRVGEVGPALAGALQACVSPLPRDRLLRRLRQLGAGGVAVEVLEGLVADGLLTRLG